MQRIERYGVIALVVLLVTILAVSVWGESKSGWQFWKKDAKKDSASAETRPGRRGANAPNSTGALEGRTLPLDQPMSMPQSSPLAGAPGADPAAGVLPLVDAQGQPQPGASSSPSGAPAPILGLESAPLPTPGVALNPQGRAADPSAHPVLRGQPEQTKRELAAGAGLRKYTVRGGDTLGEIAARELGSSSRWNEIQQLNGNLDPKKLRAGMTLSLPAGKSLASAPAGRSESKGDSPNESKPKAKPSGLANYVVKSGDTLSKIASRELGDADRWTDIRDLNPGVDPKRLEVGTRLSLPSSTVAKVESRETVGWGPRTSGKSRVQ